MPLGSDVIKKGFRLPRWWVHKDMQIVFLSSATLLQTFKDAVTGGYSVGSNKSCITKNLARKKRTGPCLAELLVTGKMENSIMVYTGCRTADEDA